MILQVHDELVFRVPTDELPRMAALVRETMEHAMTLDVPIGVDVKAGKNWLDMDASSSHQLRLSDDELASVSTAAQRGPVSKSDG